MVHTQGIDETERRVAESWAKAKRKQLDNGYASQWDRRTARLIRQREQEGIETSAEQRAFATRVEEIAND